MLATFTYPYLSVLLAAAYSVHQSLEGLGISTSHFVQRDGDGQIVGAYWSATEAVLAPFGVLILFAFALVVLTLIAGYCLGRRKGVCVIAMLWLLPGVAALFGFAPVSIGAPGEYVLGSGYTGPATGMLCLAGLALGFGWACNVVLTDAFALGDRYRSIYDHAWYALAVLAGVFFVADIDSSRSREALRESQALVRDASSYLTNQMSRVSRYCTSNGRARTKDIEHACRWAADPTLRFLLNTYVDAPINAYVDLGPRSSAEVYAPYQADNKSESEIQALRHELAFINDSYCRSTTAQAIGDCSIAPARFLSNIEPPATQAIVFTPVLSAHELIVPTLVRETARAKKLVTHAAEDNQNRHLRWLFYIVLAALAGGKVANATARAFPGALKHRRTAGAIRALKRKGVGMLTAFGSGLVRRISSHLRALRVPGR